MQEKNLFEYAIIRLVPRVEREEFLNIGVMLFCKRPAFLHMKYTLDESRILSFYGKTDLAEVQSQLEAFEKICEGKPEAGPIAALDVPSRFRWLTAKRSTIIQTSEVHPGICIDSNNTLQRLFEQLVIN